MKDFLKTLALFWTYIFIPRINGYGEFDGSHLKKDSIFTSLADMEPLSHLETMLHEDFKNFLKAEERRLEELRSLIKRIEERGAGNSQESISFYASHPTGGFNLLKNFIDVWPEFDRTYSSSGYSTDELRKLRDTLSKYRRYFPEDDDVQGSIWGLFRLQDTYRLSARDVASGLGGVQQNLTVEELFEIGYLAASASDYYHAVGWLRECYRQFPKGARQVGFLDITNLLEYLAWAEYQVGNLEAAIWHAETILKIDPKSEQAQVNIEFWERDLKASKTNPSVRKHAKLVLKDWEENYNRNCRGKVKMSQKEKNKLYCKYISPHPIFILKPVKLELAFINPRIEIYHDILKDADANDIIQFATPRLKRATIHHPVTGRLSYADYRVSESAWLGSDEFPVVEKINKTVAALLGLNLRYCEDLQVVNYGIGGQYEPHFDHATQKKSNLFRAKMGNRIGTALFYLTNVERGGHTVFVEPEVRASVPPKKGSMIFWYNLHRSGAGNNKTRHAACPVLVGRKWVANLWIHEYGQEFKRPCGLTPDAI